MEQQNSPNLLQTDTNIINYQDKSTSIQGSLDNNLNIKLSELENINLQFENNQLIGLTIADLLQLQFKDSKLHNKSTIFKKEYLFDNNELVQ